MDFIKRRKVLWRSLQSYCASDRYQGGPAPLLQGELFRPQWDGDAGESASIVPFVDRLAGGVFGSEGLLYT